MIGGVNLTNDAMRIGREVNTLIPKTYDNLKKLVSPRPGFVEVSNPQTERAVSRAGFILDAFLKRFNNPATGEVEHVFYHSRGVDRMLYDAKGKNIGAVTFQYNDSSIGKGLMPQVFKPAEDGSKIMIKSDGTEKALGEVYDFNIGDIGYMDNNSGKKFYF